jgi:hypothetical protein
MPLITEDIFQARAAYAALELRAQLSEQNAANLQATINNFSSLQQSLAQSARLLTQFTVSQVQTNAQLTAQQAGEVSPDLTLESFIASIGLALALGEATMPDRAISSATATVQSYLAFGAEPDGVSRVAGLRLYQPELGAPAALATTSLEIAKVIPAPGAPAPRNLYAVLQDKQSLFTDPFWSRFVTAEPVSQPSGQIVTEIAKVFANIGVWTLPFLIQGAAAIAGFETSLTTLIGGAVPPERAAAYATAVGALSALVKALDPATRSGFVAGDLFALAAALDATTKIAITLRP